ncbi:MAG: hypothetical protein LKJ03_03640 [Enterococcaceae bacterium]|nr:hypothetical protein [Enterococcaceae bacterium]MCI1918957.1 hypothetical protein [Enterococcaceae bacterium]
MVKKWTDYSDDEIKNMVKEEIIRCGIADYPSRTRYNENYDNEKAPSAVSLMNRFKLKWPELMESLGFEYDKEKMATERSKKIKGATKKTKWNTLSDEELFSVFKGVVIAKNITMVKEYKEKTVGEDAPSYGTIISRLGNIAPLLARIKRERVSGKKEDPQ